MQRRLIRSTTWEIAGALWFGLCGNLPAQHVDINQRVRNALQPSGQQSAAMAELQSKKFSSVIERLKAVKPANDSEHAALLALEGAVAFLSGNMAEAAADFSASEQIEPAQENDRFTHAMALVRMGNDPEARKMIAALAKEHVERALYWYWLGRLDYDERRYQEAIGNLQKAAELDPASVRTWDSLGLAWDMQGKVQAARPAFEKAVNFNRIQAQPSPWPPHNLGSLLLRMGETEPAETALRESLRYDAKLGKTHYLLGRTLEKEARFADAAAEYRLSVELDPQATDGCYALAMLYRKLHRDNEAEAMFKEFRRRKQSGS